MRARKRASLLLMLALGGAGAQPDEPPPIGTIDFYGLRTIAESAAREKLPFSEGDLITAFFADEVSAELTLTRALGVARVELAAVCCTEAGLMQIYVGVQEQAAADSRYLPVPTGTVRLPDEIYASMREFEMQLMAAVLGGNAREDRSQGHSLTEYAPLRAVQERFLGYAAQYRGVLVEALHGSANAEDRAAAALVLGYVRDKASITADLSRAVFDSDEGVRNNATRSLAVIAGYANDHPELGIDIDARPFVATLDSIVWSDRNKGLAVLTPLTAARPPELLDALEAAVPSLIDMCGWQSWGHASTACVILQRIAGAPDDFEPTSRGPTLERARAMLRQ